MIAQYYVDMIDQFPCENPTLQPTTIPTPQAANSGDIIQPHPLSTFDLVLSANLEMIKNANVIDIDAFSATAELVDQFHAKETLIIAGISVGSWEDWRPDISLIPAGCIGSDYSGRDGEKFLDIHQIQKRKMKYFNPG